MKFLLRWIANSIAFYLALYLLDSLIAPRFWVQAVWVAVVLAIFLALVDSLIRPLHRLRTRPYRALVIALFALIVNALVLQIFVWAGEPRHDQSGLGARRGRLPWRAGWGHQLADRIPSQGETGRLRSRERHRS